ncbi:hypothetical protein niasHT_022767 [Heterodera trifolii]|uniref:Uncharacterized protein n=1 Tax=Heterodera trifolii TaxID=157864 RepID=A0ABD2K672_9BILA
MVDQMWHLPLSVNAVAMEVMTAEKANGMEVIMVIMETMELMTAEKANGMEVIMIIMETVFAVVMAMVMVMADMVDMGIGKANERNDVLDDGNGKNN